MIIYDTKENFIEQVNQDTKELENYKNSYNRKIELYTIYLNSVDFLADKCGEDENGIINYKDKITKKLDVFRTQILEVDEALKNLKEFLVVNENSEKHYRVNNEITQYNIKYMKIKDNFINNSIYEESIMLDYIKNQTNVVQHNYNEAIKTYNICEDETIVNNDTLLISETQNKVILPYTSKEINDILNDEKNNYQSVNEVIENIFTRPFSDYKVQFISRYSETMKLAKDKEKCGLTEAINLSIEMMKKKYLHPAIITACRNLDELDVYLDCLDKNELDDFKIFKIKYELHPVVVKTKDDIHAKTSFWTKLWKLLKKDSSKEVQS